MVVVNEPLRRGWVLYLGYCRTELEKVCSVICGVIGSLSSLLTQC